MMHFCIKWSNGLTEIEFRWEERKLFNDACKGHMLRSRIVLHSFIRWKKSRKFPSQMKDVCSWPFFYEWLTSVVLINGLFLSLFFPFYFFFYTGKRFGLDEDSLRKLRFPPFFVSTPFFSFFHCFWIFTTLLWWKDRARWGNSLSPASGSSITAQRSVLFLPTEKRVDAEYIF